MEDLTSGRKITHEAKKEIVAPAAASDKPLELSRDPEGGTIIRTFEYPGHLIKLRKLNGKQVKTALLDAMVQSLKHDGCDPKGFMRKFSMKKDGSVVLQAVAELSRFSLLWNQRPTIEADDLAPMMARVLPSAQT